MVSSSKGKPTDPKLKEKVTEEIKNKPNKDGGGKGQMSAWKAAQIGKEYEARGGDYENESGSKNEPKKGTPEAKSDDKKKKEEKKPADGEGAGKKEAQPKKAKSTTAKKAKEPPREGTRKSSRVADQKRSAPKDEEEKPAASSKKAKTGKK